MHSLNGKLAVITGGTDGIGLAVAKNYVASGAKVVISGRRDTGDSIAAGINASFQQCDVTDPDDVKAMFTAVEAEHGQIDILVANAGIAFDEHSIGEFSVEQMQQLMSVNFNGVFFALKFGPEHMRQGGTIIVTGSVTGSGTTIAGAGVYAASKAAAAYLTRTAALELAARDIRANAVCPAFISGTQMMIEDDGGAEATALGNMTALGRMGQLDEVVGVYNFLAGDSSRFITGQEICVDGGLTAGIVVPS